MTLYSWLCKRSIGLKYKFGDYDSVCNSIYTSLEARTGSNINSHEEMIYGGVFNLEFSPDGSILIAACEKKSIAFFDTNTTVLTKVIKNAHGDCVNCVKFLDSRVFATCSDDSTVAIWDIRNLKNKIRTLRGHSNWVKNIEYSTKDKLLVTSGFDGSIYTWDINSSTENNCLYSKVFHTTGLMRCRISPDGTRLVICTTGGYLIIIHNLDLTKLEEDLKGFRPNIYRLMQLGRQFIPFAAKYDRVFSKTRKRNRVELVSDFPENNDAEVVSSLQIHPQGWCALSRNISYDESSEWTCIHDIQELDNNDDENDEDSQTVLNENDSETPSALPGPIHPDIWEAEMTVRERSLRSSDVWMNSTPVVYGISSGVIRNIVPTPQSDSPSTSGNKLSKCDEYTSKLNGKKIKQNTPRMLHYIEEPNKGKGFIKELCFSADGRIICSPYGFGVRLLSFSKDCKELPYCIDPNGKPQKLHTINLYKCHKDIVVSTKFSPVEPLIVSGCLRGKVIWHQPKL